MSEPQPRRVRSGLRGDLGDSQDPPAVLFRPLAPPLTARRAVFLDRDGVLNPPVERDGRRRAPLTLDEFAPYPWAGAVVDALRAAGWLCLCVTNQPDVARGRLDPAALEAMHDRLLREVGVHAVYVCPHDDEDGCECRKPRPGLLLHAAAEWDVDPKASFLVGDRWRDVEAGQAAGVRTILVRGPENGTAHADHVVADLREAAALILRVTGDRA